MWDRGTHKNYLTLNISQFTVLTLNCLNAHLPFLAMSLGRLLNCSNISFQSCIYTLTVIVQLIVGYFIFCINGLICPITWSTRPALLHMLQLRNTHTCTWHTTHIHKHTESWKTAWNNLLNSLHVQYQVKTVMEVSQDMCMMTPSGCFSHLLSTTNKWTHNKQLKS